MTTRHETRARELMLFPDVARRYVALYSHWDDCGKCPACGESLDGYESTIYRHIHTCQPLIASTTYEERPCAFCAAMCSTHPDAGNPLAPCQDCGKVTCPDHRVADEADRCVECAAIHYRTNRAHARHAELQAVARGTSGADAVAAYDALFGASTTSDPTLNQPDYAYANNVETSNDDARDLAEDYPGQHIDGPDTVEPRPSFRYAYAVVKRGAVTVFVHDFTGGYIGWMLQDAQACAKAMRGRLRKSALGHLVETMAPDVATDRAFAEMFDTDIYHVHGRMGHVAPVVPPTPSTRPSASFWVFSRTWWKRNPNVPGGREPGAGRRTTLARVATEDEARAICRQYNDTHDPGLLSRKAEYEQLS